MTQIACPYCGHDPDSKTRVQLLPRINTVVVDSVKYRVSPTELAIIEILIEHKFGLATKREIFEHVKTTLGTEMTDNMMSVTIHNLRKNIPALKIINHRSIGWSIEGAV